MASPEYLSLYLGTDTSSLFQQTLEACGNLRYSVDSVCSFKQNIQALGFDSCFGQPHAGYKHDLSPDGRITSQTSECKRSKPFFSCSSEPGYSGSCSSCQWESDHRHLKAFLNTQEQHTLSVDDYKGVSGY